MTLYIEYVIIDNFVVDYMLIGLMGVCTKQKLKVFNKILSCAIGTISALFLPYIIRLKYLTIIYKLLTLFIMILALKKYKNIKNYFFNIGLMLLFTFAFGGTVLCALNLFQIKYTLSGVLLYSFEFPMGLLILLFLLGFWLLKKIIIALNHQLKLNNYIYNIKLIDNDVSIDAIGYFDSGNLIQHNGQAVSIISSELFFKLYKNYSFDKFLFRNIDESILKDASYIEINSIAKGGKYLTFKIDKMIVGSNEFNNTYLAVSVRNFKNFDCVINSQLIGG